MGEGSISVLIVEDHRMVAEGLSRALSAEPDIDVVGTAATLAEAHPLVRRLHPDVVLMDYRLPDGDGITATRHIHTAQPSTRVVILTASDDATVLADALEAGCSGYVTKDRSVLDMVAAVRAAHRGTWTVSGATLGALLQRARRPAVDLTAREAEVLELMGEGLTNAAMAARLDISVNTVRNHVQSLIAKLGAHSKLEAVAIALRDGLIRVG